MYCPRILSDARHITIILRLNNILVSRCASQAAAIKSKRPPNVLEKPDVKEIDVKAVETKDKLVMYERKVNRWGLIRSMGLSCYIIGIPAAVNFVDIGRILDMHWVILGCAAFCLGGWWLALTANLSKSVRVLEYSRPDNTFHITVIGKTGKPVVKKYPAGHALYNGTVKDRVYIKTVDKEYVIYTSKGSYQYEAILWHLLRKEYVNEVEDDD